ncbi:dual specificity protein phosphatase 1 isoform X1 [Cryptomeria japonica]|uniref:dual specificity protein phosphatase 1 isoform X1 n=1 Tax=Cryptomeria japonica TaxID=3369 RepID=UPI0025ACD89F|nr:dual specificity protein phosphatase 1 isoform X1 [Cryptomeria japonica]XP_057872660.1 dual specificity protein phosphatase 1 isoform X1 [Cryptomeria japonica]XP_057872661.1 dual specificity protein phosphatase 1 isoform X1 [Cryptomeria japonica]XP_057872666.1 dual specificity protein phosphatase 1 isoform X1 [Cryptomeria japonica]
MASIDTRKERMAKFIRALYLAKYVKNDNIPCEIEPGLFLGSIGAAQNKSVLKSLNVTHVLLVANALEPAYPNDFKYKKVEVLDSVDTDLEQHFEECFTFIDEAKQEEGGVLVHCFAGRSRSVTIIVAYLMRTHRMSLCEALELVKSKRPQAAPNQGFLLQLQHLESCLGVVDKPVEKETFGRDVHGFQGDLRMGVRGLPGVLRTGVKEYH